jgi:putative exosortase-associated protein (TIGR04073 family)
MRRAVGVVVVALALGGVTPAWAEHTGYQAVRDAVWKLGRGVTNVVTGLPAEVSTRTVSSVSGPDVDSIGSMLSNLASGLVLGSCWGLVRIGSGMVDVVTFPVPFDDNRPLLEPEFAL